MYVTVEVESWHLIHPGPGPPFSIAKIKQGMPPINQLLATSFCLLLSRTTASQLAVEFLGLYLSLLVLEAYFVSSWPVGCTSLSALTLVTWVSKPDQVPEFSLLQA